MPVRFPGLGANNSHPEATAAAVLSALSAGLGAPRGASVSGMIPSCAWPPLREEACARRVSLWPHSRASRAWGVCWRGDAILCGCAARNTVPWPMWPWHASWRPCFGRPCRRGPHHRWRGPHDGYKENARKTHSQRLVEKRLGTDGEFTTMLCDSRLPYR